MILREKEIEDYLLLAKKKGENNYENEHRLERMV